jgi:hypothetical protein
MWRVSSPADRYAGVTAALGSTVWNSGCDSWYLTDEGNVDLCPPLPQGHDTVLAQVDENNYPVTRAIPAS